MKAKALKMSKKQHSGLDAVWKAQRSLAVLLLNVAQNLNQLSNTGYYLSASCPYNPIFYQRVQ
jgi:hypothetical protein